METKMVKELRSREVVTITPNRNLTFKLAFTRLSRKNTGR